MLDKNEMNPMELIVNSTGALVYVIDLESYEILYANEKCKKEFGDVIGKVCYKTLQNNEDSPCSFCPEQKNENPLSYSERTDFEWENENSINGKYYLFNDRIVSWNGNRKAKIQVGIDITEQKKLENDLLDEKNSTLASFEALLDSTIEGLFIYDKNKICIQVNKVAPVLFGYSESEMLGKKAFNFVAPESYDLVKQMIQNSNQEPYEAVMLRKDGSTFPAILRGHDLILAGKKRRVSAILDITDIKSYEKKILKLAHYDILTSLPNRLLFKEYIQKAIKKSKRTYQYNALLFIDLDNFKAVNDTVGHNVGDMVLVETARRIENCVRENDVVARLGGDEFVLLVDTCQTSREIVIDIIGIIAQKILDELRAPYLIENYNFQITGSIGIKLFSDDSLSRDELMKYADSAMYNAKDKGGNTFSFYNPELQQMMENKVFLVNSLRKAIEDNSMSLHYQAQVLAGDNQKIVGVEALVRWNHPEKGLISPASFIPAAEESGLIIPLGELILDEAIKQVQTWQEDEVKSSWRVSVNVSSKQFEGSSFIPTLQKILKKYRVNADMIRLELTEGILIQNTDEALKKLYELKEIGISLSIDDFGTGYSSLSYLKQLPIDELKIDQSFIKDLISDKNDEIITKTIISIGEQFGLEVIAEGVETQEQYEKLLLLGCKNFQGYLFCKPMPAELL